MCVLANEFDEFGNLFLFEGIEEVAIGRIVGHNLTEE